MFVRIKSPETQEEFAAMWRLNHRTFSDELGQHAPHADGMLIDKLHAQNIYRIALSGEHLVGMISAHTGPFFSAVGHFGALMEKEILPGKTGEIRLLAVEKSVRGSAVAIKLCAAISDALKDSGIEKVIITGVASRKGFYQALGLRAIGAPVRDGAAIFYPMVGVLAEMRERRKNLVQRLLREEKS